MKQSSKLKRISNYFIIASIIFMIIMIGCSLPSDSKSSSKKSSNKKTKKVTALGNINIEIDPSGEIKNKSASLKYLINNKEYTVTALNITVTYVPASSVTGVFNWTPAVGATTYSVGISQYGGYEVKVVQTAENNGDTVTKENAVIVDIQPIKIMTKVTIVSGASLDIIVDDGSGSGSSTWTILFGVAGGATEGKGIALDSSGNIYIAGSTTGNLDGQTKTGIKDLFILKYNSSGVKQWTRLLGASGADTRTYGMTLDSSGNVYATGFSEGNFDGLTKTGTEDLFVVKYDTNGNKQWTKLLGVAAVSTIALDITSDSSGNVYTIGKTMGNLDGQIKAGFTDLFVVKYNTNGSKQWTRLLGIAGAHTSAHGITSDSSGNIYVTGRTEGNLDGLIKTGTEDLFVVKYDTNGNKQWTRLLGVSSAETGGLDITLDSGGNIYVSGETGGNLDGQTLTGTNDLIIVKFNSNGVKQWTRLLGASGANTGAMGIKLDSSGNIYTTGWVDWNGVTGSNFDGQPEIGDEDSFVVKYDTNGNKQWTRLLGVAGTETNAKDIALNSSGYIYTTGFSEGNLDGKTKTGIEDLFILKYNSSGVKQ